MNTVPALLKRYQSRKACEVSSGPLSIRKNRGARPRAQTSRSSSATSWSADAERPTRIVSAWRVCSSRTLTSRSGRPQAVWSACGDLLQHDVLKLLVGQEVDRPHVVLGRGGDRAPVRPVAGGRTLAHPPRHAQALFAPDALHALAVDVPPLLDEVLVRTAVAPPLALARELAQSRPQRLVVSLDGRVVALRGAVLTSDSAGQRSLTPRRSRSIATAQRRRAGLTIRFTRIAQALEDRPALRRPRSCRPRASPAAGPTPRRVVKAGRKPDHSRRRRVVLTRLLRRAPWIPAWRISRRVWSQPMSIPSKSGPP